MQPEYLIAGPHALLQSAPSIEVLDLARPCVAALDPRNKRLADPELSGDVLLHAPICDCREHGGISPVECLHALALAADDAKRMICLFSLDGDERANCQQKALYIRGGGYGEAEQPLVASLHATAILFNPAIPEPLMDGVQCRPEGVGEPQSHPAFVLVDLDAAFPVKEASDVAQEGVFTPIHHPYSLAHARVSNNAVMAVPVMRWIGERIQLVERMAPETAA